MWATRRLSIILIATVLLITAGAGAGRAIDPGPLKENVVRAPAAASPSAAPPMSPALQVTEPGSEAKYPDAAHNSEYDEYLVVWKGYKEIWGRRVSSRGQPLGTQFQIATGPTANDGRPKVAYDAKRNRYLVIWGRSAEAGLSYHMYGRFVDWNGPNPALPAFLIDASMPAKSSVYALTYARTQDEFLVIWAANVSGTTRRAIVGRRVRANGSGFPANPFWITSHASDNRDSPDVAYNPYRNEYLVVCDDYPKVNENIFGVRLAGNGAVLDGGEFGITHWGDDEFAPAIAACPTGDQYLVAWHSIQAATLGDGVYARLVSGAGAPGIVKEIAHYSSWWHARPLDVDCGATGLLMEDPRYLVTWDTMPDFDGTNYAREMSTSGMLSDPVEIDRWSRPAAVAGGRVNFLVVWDTNGDSLGYGDIYARIVGNTVPSAAFTVNPTEGYSGTLFQFDASSSSDATDPTGQLQVRWDWDHDGTYDTPWSRTKTESRQFVLEPWTSMEVKIVQMEVTDGHGVSDTTTKDVTIRNAPPWATFTVSPSNGDTNTSFLFDASASTDVEGGTLQTLWDWEDDGTFDTTWSENLTARHTFTAPGTYTIRLNLGDNWEQLDTTTRQVTVGGAPPVYKIYLPLSLRRSG